MKTNKKPDNKNVLAIGAIVMGIVLIALVSIKYFQSRPVQVTNTTQQPTDSISNDESNDIVEAEGELVDGFPDFPVYPGAELEKSSQTSYNGMTGYAATWEAKGTVPTIMNWYKAKAKANKWEVVDEPSNSTSTQEQNLWLSVNGQRINVNVELEDNKVEPEINIEVLPQ